MSFPFTLTLLLALPLISLGADPVGPAPPAIATGGVRNAASNMSPELPGGGVAPGSLIRIRGWRLSGETDRAVVSVHVNEQAATSLRSEPNEILALLPVEMPLGPARLTVTVDGHESPPVPVQIVPRSFGIFTRNGKGWGPGQIFHRNGSPVSDSASARSGELLTLRGTGLHPTRGAQIPTVLVAGQAVRPRTVGSIPGEPGIDRITFRLPASTPTGCYVPIQVVSAPGTVSNTATLAVASGKNCEDVRSPAWSQTGSGSHATIILARADVELFFGSQGKHAYRMDSGFASFEKRGAIENPLAMAPPEGSCSTFTGLGLMSFTSGVGLFRPTYGSTLDAGPALTLRSATASVPLPKRASTQRYSEFLAGQSPLPWTQSQGFFLDPGDLILEVPGGADVGPFETTVRLEKPLIWNTAGVQRINLDEPFTVHWTAQQPDSTVVIVASNVLSDYSLSLCLCAARASAGTFTIPASGLANIPPTPPNAGFPFSIVAVAEVPVYRPLPIRVRGLTGATAFFVSVVARSVIFDPTAPVIRQSYSSTRK